MAKAVADLQGLLKQFKIPVSEKVAEKIMEERGILLTVDERIDGKKVTYKVLTPDGMKLGENVPVPDGSVTYVLYIETFKAFAERVFMGK